MYPFNDHIAIGGKAGISRYSVDVEFIADEEDDEKEHFLVQQNGVELSVSGSLILTLNENNAVDFSVSKMFGDYGTTLFSLNFYYIF